MVIILSIWAGKTAYTEGLERGEEMIRTGFIYLVLFATLMMVIGGSVAAFSAIADLVSPPLYYQSFEQYKGIPEEKRPGTTLNETESPALSEAELRLRYDQMVAEEKERVQQRAVNSLIKSCGWIIIPLPVFLYFQRRVKNQPS